MSPWSPYVAAMAEDYGLPMPSPEALQRFTEAFPFDDFCPSARDELIADLLA